MKSKSTQLMLAIGVMVTLLALALGLTQSPLLSEGAAPTNSATTLQAPTASSPTEGAKVVEATVVAKGMHFVPNELQVPAGATLRLTLKNEDEGMVHDLSLGGVLTKRLNPGETQTIEVGPFAKDTEGWCTIPGHREAGMTLAVKVSAEAGAAASAPAGDPAAGTPSADMNSQMPGHMHQHASADQDLGDLLPVAGAKAPVVDPVAPPMPTTPAGTIHQVTLRAQELPLQVAPGWWQQRWTFNGGPRGPILRGKVGDTFEVTLINEGTMGHSLDFHAGNIAPDQPMRTIAPGQSLKYVFKAERAGIWLYHCSTAPMSAHIAAGMHGAVIVDPPDLQPVDHEFVLEPSEIYLQNRALSAAVAQPVSVTRAKAVDPSFMTFNGVAFGYDQAPLQVKKGERVRIWLMNAGPNLPSAFHVVGGQFDTVYAEGAWRLKDGKDAFGHEGNGSQVLPLAPAEGGFVEMTFPQPGHYTFVTHAMAHAEKGEKGQIVVTD
ncbi:multicopper oxidase domain-containing protein [Boudabousia tangfeifanii]|uniref:multicopper oxidase domain-containing protein n=1 Tax=Boudabousia tangfeifanii TaxID=1912795 RepID=UPI000A56FE2E|nr:multicopper oxidase domain-containing protein [Boudabousia tangfeifanii]